VQVYLRIFFGRVVSFRGGVEKIKEGKLFGSCLEAWGPGFFEKLFGSSAILSIASRLETGEGLGVDKKVIRKFH
jgi:hypothetical protein